MLADDNVLIETSREKEEEKIIKNGEMQENQKVEFFFLFLKLS